MKKNTIKASKGYLQLNENDWRLTVWIKILTNKVRMKKGIKLAEKFSEQTRYDHADKGKKFTAIVGDSGIFVFHRYDILAWKKSGVFKSNVDAIAIRQACYYDTSMKESQKKAAIKKQIDVFEDQKSKHLQKKKYRRKYKAYSTYKPCGQNIVNLCECDKVCKYDRDRFGYKDCNSCGFM